MKFFVPHADPDDAEKYLGELAASCHCSVPAPGERMMSVSFVHNGEDWTATVGAQLRGTKTVQRRREAGVVDVTTQLPDSAMVLAIFPGAPVWYVVTNGRPMTGVASAWENPFMVGEHAVRMVTRFDPPASQPADRCGLVGGWAAPHDNRTVRIPRNTAAQSSATPGRVSRSGQALRLPDAAPRPCERPAAKPGPMRAQRQHRLRSDSSQRRRRHHPHSAASRRCPSSNCCSHSSSSAAAQPRRRSASALQPER